MNDIIKEGMVIDNIRFIKLIADRGRRGAIWYGKDEDINRPVAVKLFIWPPDETHDATLGQRQREATLWASIQHHNVITLYAYVPRREITTEDGKKYCLRMFVMESANSSLDADLERRQRTRGIQLRWMSQILAGLAAAHAKGVIHRDVKPANVLLVNEHRVGDVAKLSDFGIAHPDDTEGTSSWIGTPPYAAPEQHAGTFSKASDIYGLGMTFLHMLLGNFKKFKAVLRGTGDRKIFHRPAIATVRADLEEAEWSRDTLDLIERMVSANEQNRPDIEHVIRSIDKLTATNLLPIDVTKPAFHLLDTTKNWRLLFRNQFVWHPSVHEAFDETLLYFWIRGFFSLSDLRNAVAEMLEPITQDMFCSYEVYGGHDAIVRVWTNESTTNVVISRVRRLGSLINGTVETLRVEKLKYIWSTHTRNPSRKSVTEFFENEEAIEEPNLRKNGLIIGDVPKLSAPTIKGFTRITTHGERLNSAKWQYINALIDDRFGANGSSDSAGERLAGRISTYLGSLGQFGDDREAIPCVVVKFNARDFYGIDSIPYSLHEDSELRRMGIRTDTYLVTSLGMQESDDGPFLAQQLDKTFVKA